MSGVNHLSPWAALNPEATKPLAGSLNIHASMVLPRYYFLCRLWGERGRGEKEKGGWGEEGRGRERTEGRPPAHTVIIWSGENNDLEFKRGQFIASSLITEILVTSQSPHLKGTCHIISAQ